MAKRKRSYRRYFTRVSRHAKKMTIPLAPIAGILGAPAVGYAVGDAMAGNYPQALNDLKSIVGITSDGRFDFNLLKINMTPVVAGLLIHKLVGGKLGLNATLGKAGVPIIRI